MIWAGQMMLEHLGENEAADAVMKAIKNVLKEAKDAQLIWTGRKQRRRWEKQSKMRS